MSIHDFFEGVIFEQLVKTKQQASSNSGTGQKNARKVEIIEAKDFFTYLQARGVRKSSEPHVPLQKILQLDPNYPDLILVKRLSKALDEIAKNEELMEGILAAAADNNDGMDGQLQPAPIDEEDEEEGGNGHTGRLKTIGEEEDQKGLGTQPTVKQLHEEQEENEDEYDENPNNNDDEDDGDEYI